MFAVVVLSEKNIIPMIVFRCVFFSVLSCKTDLYLNEFSYKKNIY